MNGSSPYQQQQDLALANCFAQAQAFAFGQTEEQVRADLAGKGLPESEIARLIPHKLHPGNRPSSVILFPRLGPKTLGRLIALYEHKVFTQSVIWGINAFDQWGVELGQEARGFAGAGARESGRRNGRRIAPRLAGSGGQVALVSAACDAVQILPSR